MVSQSEIIDVPPWRPEHFVGGHPALNLINTISHRRNPSLAIDRMNSAQKITTWCAFEGLLSQQDGRALAQLCQIPEVEAELISAIARLRNATGEIFDAISSQQEIPPVAMAQVLSMSSDTRVAISNIPDDYRSACQLSVNDVAVEAVVALIALLVIDGMFRLPVDRIRTCSRCGWVFCDSSKGGRRRWCSMRACGNREKVGRHYRHKQR